MQSHHYNLMIQTTPQNLEAMTDLQRPPKRPLPEDHAESPPPADEDFDNPFSIAFLTDLWQNISKECSH
jgi:hypothetical protein